MRVIVLDDAGAEVPLAEFKKGHDTPGGCELIHETRLFVVFKNQDNELVIVMSEDRRLAKNFSFSYIVSAAAKIIGGMKVCGGGQIFFLTRSSYSKFRTLKDGIVTWEYYASFHGTSMEYGSADWLLVGKEKQISEILGMEVCTKFWRRY